MHFYLYHIVIIQSHTMYKFPKKHCFSSVYSVYCCNIIRTLWLEAYIINNYSPESLAAHTEYIYQTSQIDHLNVLQSTLNTILSCSALTVHKQDVNSQGNYSLVCDEVSHQYRLIFLIHIIVYIFIMTGLFIFIFLRGISMIRVYLILTYKFVCAAIV